MGDRLLVCNQLCLAVRLWVIAVGSKLQAAGRRPRVADWGGDMSACCPASLTHVNMILPVIFTYLLSSVHRCFYSKPLRH